MKVLSTRQEQIVLGSVFGDASLNSLNTPLCNSGFRVSHTEKDKDYVFWKYWELKSTGLFFSPPKPRNLGGFRRKRVSWLLQSRRHPDFTYFRILFYPDGKKVAPKECLERLEPLGLAVWYMDDGNLSWKYRGQYIEDKYLRVSLATCSFTYSENEVIKAWLRSKFGFHFYINLNPYPLLRLGRRDEVREFISLVKPYVIPCMERKVS